ncbi:ATP F0F1 synthase subunit I [Aggregatibacter aphrophilus]|jgi:ATP synthase I chain|nr:ATP F0F1 synthase subunit I [Aggregatibacter aphrophilus]RDE96459.1 ATP F0F1 synthase subunit I [Aggregatibacter aphrophilus]
MSQVLTQAKNRYQKAILLEMGFILIFGALMSIWQWKSAVDFCLGFFSAFLPFCAFIYLIFYRKQNLSTKLTALYRGEAIKFILTILFIVVSFKWLGVSQFFLFFTGFFMALVLNNLVPFLLNRS